MSDEEERASEGEEEAEEEEEEAAEEEEEEQPAEEAQEVKPKPRPPPRQDTPPQEMTEAEMAMMAAKRKHEEEESVKMQDYMEQRNKEKEVLEEELYELKQKQMKRKEERKEEDRVMLERRKQEDERRRQEEEERKQKSEEVKARKDAEKMKRLAMMAGNLAGGKGIPGAGANFVVQKNKADKSSMPPGSAQQQKGEKSKEQLDEAKQNFLSSLPALAIDGASVEMLRDKIKQLHTRICKLEAEKYDLEKRHERQNYDLKELGERQRQQARQKALKKGLDPEEAANSSHPPKLPTASKYDRQIDRRSYGDRQVMFNDPKKPKDKKIFHGTARPPTDWGRKDSEELEMLRKNLEPPKYQEVVKDENAKPPVPFIPSVVPELDEDDEPRKKPSAIPPPEPEPAPPAAEPEPEPEPEEDEEEEEE